MPHSLPQVTYLWKDMLKLHSAFPLHCVVGGGACGTWWCGSGSTFAGSS